MSIGSNQPFRPAGTVGVSAGSTSASVALLGVGETVLVTNATSSLAFVAFGTTPAVTATSGGVPVLPNGQALLAANTYMTYAAAKLANGTGPVYFTLGDGSVI